MIELLVRSIPICLAGLCLGALLRRRSAAENHLAVGLTLAALLLLPLFHASVPVSAPPGAIRPLFSAAWQGDAPGSRAALEKTTDLAPREYAAPPQGTLPVDWRGMAIAVYWMGCSFLAVRAAAGILRLRRCLRRSRPAGDGSGALVSDAVRVPVTFWWIRHRILVPPVFDSWDDDTRTAVLIHERAHVQRGDWLWLLVACAARTIYWPNSLVWLLERRLRGLAEEAADDCVVSRGVPPTCYAQALLDVARGLGRSHVSMGLPMVRRESEAARRIVGVLSDRRREAAGATAILILTASLAAVSIPAASWNAEAERQSTGAMARNNPSGPRLSRILDHEGRPVAGAAFYVFVTGSAGNDAIGRVLASSSGRPIPYVTGPDGSLDLGTAPIRPGERLLKVVVMPREGGVDVAPAYGAAEVRLPARSFARFRAADRAGSPAVGVRITARTIICKRGVIVPDEALRERLSAVTDNNGVAGIPGLPSDCTVYGDVLDNRYAHPYLPTSADLSRGGARPMTLVLEPACTVSGTVRDDRGEPVAGVEVGAQGADGSATRVAQWDSAVTGSSGRYTLAQLGRGTVNVALNLSGNLERDWTARAHESVTLKDGEHTAGIDFRLVRGAVITGRAVYRDSGRPAVGVLIGVHGPAHPRSSAWVQKSEVDTKGNYRLRVPSGEQYVYVMLVGQTESGQTIRISDGETKSVDFEVRAAKP